MKRRNLYRSFAATSALLLAVAGCQTTMPVTSNPTATKQVNLGKLNSGKTGNAATNANGDTGNAASDSVAASSLQSLHGRLVGEDGMPLANVRVSWGDQVVMTDASGNFNFERGSDSNYLTAFPEGHAPVFTLVDSPELTIKTAASTDEPMIVSAATGAQYISGDGSLKAQIPPGALTQNTSIRISRIDTSDIPITDWYIPGIQYAVDLGGAQLNPDTHIAVTTKVDDRFVDEMKKRDSSFTPEKYQLSQDASGDWVMTMLIKGPSSTPMTAAESQLPNNELMEFGALPLPAAAPGTPTTGFQVNFVPGSYDYDDEEVRLTNGKVINAPKNTSQWHTMEHNGVFGCGSFPHCYYYGKLRTREAHQAERNALVSSAKSLNAQIAAYPAPEPNASGEVPVDPQLEALKAKLQEKEDGIRAIDQLADDALKNCDIVIKPVDINTHTTWISDDPALNTHDADGVTVHFAKLVGAFGNQDIVSKDGGLATNNAPVGSEITVTPHIDLGPVSGTTVSRTVKDGMGTIQLQIVKNSPKVTVKFKANTAIPSTLSVSYTIDGANETVKSLPVTAGKVSFYAIVPDDEYHDIKITHASGGGLAESGTMPAAKQARRNGAVSFDLNLAFSSATAK